MYDTRPWLKNYSNGVPANINADRLPNVTSFLDEVFSQYQKEVAFKCMGKTISYAEVDAKSKLFGAYLQSRGLNPGDKFAIMLPSILQYPIAIFGLFRAGLVAVNTNPLYTEYEMEHQLKDADVKGILILENFASKLDAIIDKTDVKVVIRTSIGELLGSFKGGLTDFVIRKVKRMVPAYSLENSVTFTHTLKEAKQFKLKPYQADSQETAILQYTGGTTGVSKGAILTHRNLLANMEQIRAIFLPYLTPGQEVCLSPLPLYHIFAFSVNLMALFSLNTPSVFVPNPRDLNSVIKAFKDDKISIMTGVNTLYNALLYNAKFQNLEFSLKLSVAGAMALQQSVAERWRETTGSPVVEGYGLTETSPVAAVNPLDGSEPIGMIGLPVPSTDFKIVKENGELANVGERGELCVDGPQVMKGYYNNPAESSKVLIDGWLHTGDIAIMDERGFFKIVDRKKDMILVSGFNVYPNEVEDVIALNSKVAEVCAIGVPDERSTEAIKVFIKKKDNTLTENELREHCEKYLTGYKKPKHYQFVDDLPKSNVGKILRRKLREKES